jgi:hypothetical protein
MIIRELQQSIEDIYALDTQYPVEQFVFSDPALCRYLDGGPNARDIPEKLLIRQQGDTLDVSLYLDARLLQNLNSDNPLECLHHGNLNNFCQVVEGISHFIYLIWNATHGRPVTQLEMEIQAEIDKYILCAALYARQSSGEIPRDLHPVLFECISFDIQLEGTERQRYVTANEYAKRYCGLLHRDLLRLRNGARVTREIRQFYRLLSTQKLRRINTLNSLH